MVFDKIIEVAQKYYPERLNMQRSVFRNINGEETMNLEEIYQNVIDGQAPAVQAGVQTALAEGIAADVVLKKALIAAINGPAVGFGITMTLPMDIRLASENARMGFVFNKLLNLVFILHADFQINMARRRFQ